MIKLNKPIVLLNKQGLPSRHYFLEPIYTAFPTTEMYYCQFRDFGCPPIMLFENESYTKYITPEIAEKKLLELFGDDPQTFLQNHIDNYEPKLYDTIELHPNGPGSMLHGMLGKFGIHAQPNCKCMAKAHHMNIMGPDWCEENIDTIISWLKEESENRRIPFVETLAKMLVKRAINKSRKLIKQNES